MSDDRTVINFESEDDLPKARFKGKAKAPMPSSEDLAFWEKQAGLKPVEEADRPEWFITRAEPSVQSTSSEGDDGEDAADLKDRSTDEVADQAPVRYVSTGEQHRNRPKYPLGREKHRMIFAQYEHAKDPSMSVEDHAARWDKMPPAAQANWQQGEGKEVTAKAIANRTFNIDTLYKRTERRRNTIRGLTFDTPESLKAFKEQGTLTRRSVLDNLPPVKKGAIGEASTLDPRMVEVQGERSTQPEFDWEKGAHGETVKANVGFSDDFSHHKALSNHIEELNQRLPVKAKNLPITVKGSSTAHLPDIWFNQHQNLFSNGAQLQESQFNAKDRSLLEARRSLARSAKAQSLGMKEAAVSHFRQAVDHVSTAAQHLHAQNVARGANVGEAPVEDWDKADRILTAYRKHVGV